jgi:hypothetical protein
MSTFGGIWKRVICATRPELVPFTVRCLGRRCAADQHRVKVRVSADMLSGFFLAFFPGFPWKVRLNAVIFVIYAFFDPFSLFVYER